MKNKTKEWITDDYALFENDADRTEEMWEVKIRLVTPDGITDNRITRVISRALSDSNYLYDEVSEHDVSAKLLSEQSITKEKI
jgi:hypothetical protein|tara:strand:- start:102 stop:350 length:249 start_codon:yes stop_codon:yes gene_type:complete